MFNIDEFKTNFINYYKSYDKNEYDISLIFDDFIEENENNYESIVHYLIKDNNEIQKLLNEYNNYEMILYSHNDLYSQLFDIIQDVFEEIHNDKN